MLSFGFFIEDEQCPRLMMLAFLVDDVGGFDGCC
jgi:hypothetical protein